MLERPGEAARTLFHSPDHLRDTPHPGLDPGSRFLATKKERDHGSSPGWRRNKRHPTPPFVLSLSKHVPHACAPFDKLRANGRYCTSMIPATFIPQVAFPR
jgi:hypothetical protein